MSVPLLIEHFGICVSALSGVLAARGLKVDLFGVLVLALVTAFGGGSLRDILAGDTPPVWMRSPELLYTGVITTLISFFICRHWQPPVMLLEVADALGLAFFTITGTRKGLDMGFVIPVAVILGVMTGVAGGILRDVLLRRLPLVFQPGIYLYATAAFLGGLAYCGLSRVMPLSAALWISVLIIFALRLSAIRYRIALPVFHTRDSQSDSEK
jgi:uncharacterized membrane protein YeiH